tara:strand:+ start:4696 stop:5385 length:690 start_codon:yes stop_codon:yes gene_type:complete
MGKFLGDIATDVYGVNTGSNAIQPLFPRTKFQFMCLWELGGGDTASVSTIPMTRIASVTMPGHSSRVSAQNQYNKKRLIQTGIDYSPVTMRVYDDRDAQVERFLKQASAYYYAGLMGNAEAKFADDIVSENFSGTSGTSGTGFTLRNNRYYFKNLSIVRLNTASDANVIVLRNPIISNVDGDTLDYSDGGPVQYTLQIQYEGYHVKTDAGTANELRQQITDALENPTTA